MLEFEKLYKTLQIETGYRLPEIEKNHYFVKSNLELPEEPFKLFHVLNFQEKFPKEKRIKFVVHIVLVGSMIKPKG